MNNKILIRLFVPELDYNFDVFIPSNEIVWKIKKLLAKSVSDLTGGAINATSDYALINKVTSKVYDNNEVIFETDIRNGAELLLLSVKKSKLGYEKSIPLPNQQQPVKSKEEKPNVFQNIFEKFTS
ncbi:MAG TPA: hypothetical protein DCY94_02945, partial [Firmicutes bacterium]|nr:hypothetical protein [Bacillota bacterium]